jgi:autotransporter family porin
MRLARRILVCAPLAALSLVTFAGTGSATATHGEFSSASAAEPTFGLQQAAATVTVCSIGCAFSQIAPALAAAKNGDTISIGAGTFDGGLTVDKSVKLVGAGSGRTTISGGGPVLTIGVAAAASEPTVTLDGVTVTGGVTVGNLTPFNGRGGGIYIPRAAGPSTGATVTIRNSVIRGNSVAPLEATDSGDPCCPFADAGGGGISNDGTLTLDHTVISGNRSEAAEGLTSQAIGAGILNRAFGNLTLKNSVVSDNHAAVTPPNGQEAEAAGIEMVGGTLTINDSLISNNTADLVTSLPSGVETFAGSSVHVQGSVFATVRNSTISGNTASATSLNGDAAGACGGICVDGSLVISGSTVSDNRVIATTPVGSASIDSGGLGTGCCQEPPTTVTISGSRFIDNRLTATAPAGTAIANGGGISMANDKLIRISDSLVSGNSATATTTTGSAIAHGGGVANGGLLTLRNTTVNNNTGTASGPGGEAQGGGIWNGHFGPDLPVQLTLANSAVIRNTLSASQGIILQGGGLFTTFPVTLKNTVIAQNAPDQCSGC